MLLLQRQAGNRAVAGAVRVQRTRVGAGRACTCADGGCAACAQREAGAAVQRAPLAVQRDPPTAPAPAAATSSPSVEADVATLQGTPYAALDGRLVRELANRAKWPRAEGTTLKQAIDGLSNLDIAALARIGSRITAVAPELWDCITQFPTGGAWATDNWGAYFTIDETRVDTVLKGNPRMCRESGFTVLWIHGCWAAWREITGGTAAGLHIPLKPKSDVHVDFHQPTTGRDKDCDCEFDTSSEGLGKHLETYGGTGGARTSQIARYARLTDEAKRALGQAKTDRSREQAQKALDILKSVSDKVTVYAAQGNYAPGASESKGDIAANDDKELVQKLDEAGNLAFISTQPEPESPESRSDSADVD